MKIGVNGRFLTQPYTGIGQYTLHLFGAISGLAPENEIVFFVNKPVDFDFSKNTEIAVIKELPFLPRGLRKTFWEQIQVPRAMKKKNTDIAFFPYPSNPWRKMKIPTVLTVHDVIPWTLKDYRRSFLTRLYQDRAKNAFKNADKIFTFSQCSKKDIADCCRIPPEKIEVAYNGLSPSFIRYFREATVKSLTKARNVLRKYGVNTTRPYFLYVGGYDNRKNVATILEAFLSKIAPRHEFDLVLAGGKSHNDKLYASFDLTKHGNLGNVESQKGKVLRTGFIDEDDLPVVYQFSFAFLNLSLKEGFNLPLVEAAFSGTPIVAADTSLNREIIGDYAVYTPPKDPQKLAGIMEKLIENGSYRQKQKEKMRSYKCPYDWDKTAKQILTSLSKLS